MRRGLIYTRRTEMNISSAFVDRSNTLRSGWRFAVFVAAFTLTALVFGTAALALTTALSASAQPGNVGFLTINGLVSLALALIVGWLCGKYLERLPFRSLGASFSNRWLKNLTVGLLLGGFAFAIAAAVGIAGGGLSFRVNAEASSSAVVSTLLISFAVFAVAAAFEEALFRGYMLQTFVRSELILFAALFTSTLFATVHNANPSATWLSWLNTFLAGIWFAVAYLKTRDLWLPFGLHLAWNWTQGSIFGVEVSGLVDIVKAPILRETDNGPAWLTGGEYGIEGGIACTIAIFAATVAVYFLPISRFSAPDS